MRLILLFLCSAAFAAPPALANDGFGGLTATGLTFGQTDAVAMQTEDLFISPTEIRVAYQFVNTSASDVSGEVIFPLPPISLLYISEGSMNLPEDVNRENLMNFKAVVDGVAVPVQIDRVAVIEPLWEESTTNASFYDTPGRDVTAELAQFGIPLSVDLEKVTAALLALTPAQQAEMTAAGLADFYPDGDTVSSNPNWSVILRYHWSQTFKAGAVTKISHSYENHPPGGIFGWSDPPETDDYTADYVSRYCIDAGTSKAMAKALAYTQDGETSSLGTVYNLSYVLRTANSWAGPIGKFHLTLDKGAPENVMSFCGSGVKKISPTQFVTEIDNFVPQKDLEIMVVAPIKP